MKERPILFSAPMVRAILDGRKTQTRRIVKPQPSEYWSPYSWGDVHRMRDGDFMEMNGDPVVIGWGPSNEDGDEAYVCPYGQPGDRLWVREKFVSGLGLGLLNPNDKAPFATGAHAPRWIYAADGSYVLPGGCHWRPSIHMPRWASRITLEITGIRVERLQDISEEDAKAEGATSKVKKSPWGDDIGWSMDWSQLNKYDKFALTGITQVSDICLSSPRWAFCNYINKIYGPGSWDRNDWVWVVSFRKLDA